MMAWYASRDVLEVGLRPATEVIHRIRQIEMLPDSGEVVTESDTTRLRELEHPVFRIVYRCDELHVTIVCLWRSERLMNSGLGGSA